MPDVLDLPLPPRLYVPQESDVPQEPLATRPVTAPPVANRGRKLPDVGDVRYLVLLSDSAADLPLGVFDNPDDTIRFTRDVKNDPDAHAERFYAALDIQTSGAPRPWIAITVIEFTGPMPTKRTVLFELD